MELRPLGSTGISVSPLGLGTVKFGRNEQVKYPTSFDLPSDEAVSDLLGLARDLGINILDTAPAYGTSQQRLGQLLVRRQEWVIVSKVGEIFEKGASRFDFSFEHTTSAVEETLRALRTDYLDCVLIHSDGDDLRILEREGASDALQDLKRRGLIRAHGMSTKTVAGGLRAVELLDVVMVTSHLGYDAEAGVIQAAVQQHRGVLIKKGLQSGHVAGEEGVLASFRHVFAQPGISSLIVGTINPNHLSGNVAALQRVLAEQA